MSEFPKADAKLEKQVIETEKKHVSKEFQVGDRLVVKAEQYEVSESVLRRIYQDMEARKVSSDQFSSQVKEAVEEYLKYKAILEATPFDLPEVSLFKAAAETALQEGRYSGWEIIYAKAAETLVQIVKNLSDDNPVKMNYQLRVAEYNAVYADCLADQHCYLDASYAYKAAYKFLPTRHTDNAKKLHPRYNELSSRYMHKAGDALMRAGDYHRAVGLLSQALVIREQYLPEQQRDIASTINSLASAYHHQGNYEEALGFYQRSLHIIESVLGEEHPETMVIINNMGELYRAAGDFDQALLFYQRSLEISKRIMGENHPDIAFTFNNLAGIYKTKGDLDEALTLYMRSLEINECTLGKNHPDVAAVLNNLADLQRIKGHYNQALALFYRSLDIQVNVFGEDYPGVAISLAGLGLIYSAMGDYERALPFCKQSMEITRQKLGEQHLSFRICQQNYQTLLKRMQKATLETDASSRQTRGWLGWLRMLWW